MAWVVLEEMSLELLKKIFKIRNIIVVAINEASSTLDHLIYQLKMILFMVKIVSYIK